MISASPLHATCVSIHGKGVLILGESGSGKSDLALRLIDAGAMLIGDDQIIIHKNESKLLAFPASNLHGMLEVRGVGIMHLPYIKEAPLALAVKLVARDEVERLPASEFFDCFGLKLPLLSLHAFDHSTPAKIRLHLSLQGD